MNGFAFEHKAGGLGPNRLIFCTFAEELGANEPSEKEA
jgi:hypothetical protein